MPDRRVLVIEDDAAVRLALEVFLSSEDGIAEVVTAEDGDSGIDIARRLAPDVIVTDSSMPGMSGEELGQSLRQSCPSAVIISFSGLVRDAPWADHRIPKGGSDTFDELARAVTEVPTRRSAPSEAKRRSDLHGVRNALTPITGYASALGNSANEMDADQIRDIAERILLAVDRVNDLLEESF